MDFEWSQLKGKNLSWWFLFVFFFKFSNIYKVNFYSLSHLKLTLWISLINFPHLFIASFTFKSFIRLPRSSFLLLGSYYVRATSIIFRSSCDSTFVGCGFWMNFLNPFAYTDRSSFYIKHVSEIKNPYKTTDIPYIIIIYFRPEMLTLPLPRHVYRVRVWPYEFIAYFKTFLKVKTVLFRINVNTLLLLKITRLIIFKLHCWHILFSLV